MKSGKIWIVMALLCANLVAGETPAWLDGLKFKGDFRVRGEFTDYDEDEKKNRNRARFRLRFGLEKTLSDQFKIGLRLASGAGEPTSTNQSFDDAFSGKEIWIDQIFVTYSGSTATVHAGKIKNPFETTNVVWDGDVNPEGLAEVFKFNKGFLTLGQFFVEESSSGEDSNLFAIQGGTDFGSAGSVAVAYYHFDKLHEADHIGGGNQPWAKDFHLMDVVASWSMKEHNLGFTVHYVKNIGEDAPDEFESQDSAFAAIVKYGSAKKPGDWACSYKYARIEANAVVGAFSDSDFGFADLKGHAASVSYVSHKYLTWKAALFSTDSILRTEKGFNRLQLDCQLKF